MYKKCGRDGVVEEKVGKKGVLLARRDSSIYVRKIYEHIVMMIFNREPYEDVIYYLLQEFNRLCSNSVPYKDFVVTKAVGNTNNLHLADDNCKIDGETVLEPYVDEKGVQKMKLGDYIVPRLPRDEKEREKQLRLKDATTPKEYYERCLPAQVVLAEKMKRRGQIVQNGSRLEYLITDIENHNAKQYEKIESMDYFLAHSDVLTIDFFYYLKVAINPVDEVLNTVFSKVKGFKKDFVESQYNYRYKIRRKVLEQIKNLFRPKLIIK